MCGLWEPPPTIIYCVHVSNVVKVNRALGYMEENTSLHCVFLFPQSPCPGSGRLPGPDCCLSEWKPASQEGRGAGGDQGRAESSQRLHQSASPCLPACLFSFSFFSLFLLQPLWCISAVNLRWSSRRRVNGDPAPPASGSARRLQAGASWPGLRSPRVDREASVPSHRSLLLRSTGIHPCF